MSISEVFLSTDNARVLFHQCISLDDLIDGKDVHQSIELVYYNTIMPLKKYPVHHTKYWIREPEGRGIVRLQIDNQIDKDVNIWPEVLGGSTGAALGAGFQGIGGAFLTSMFSILVANKLKEDYRRRKKRRILKSGIVERHSIYGIDLNSQSDYVIGIPDGIRVDFGTMKLTRNLISYEGNEAAKQKIAHEVINNLEANNEFLRKSLAAHSGSALEDGKELKRVSIAIGLNDMAVQTFGNYRNPILCGIIKLELDYNCTKRWLKKIIGNIGYKVVEKSNYSKKQLETCIVESFYRVGRYIDTTSSIDFSRIFHYQFEDDLNKGTYRRANVIPVRITDKVLQKQELVVVKGNN